MARLVRATHNPPTAWMARMKRAMTEKGEWMARIVPSDSAGMGHDDDGQESIWPR